MTEREALTIFRTIQKCRHQALHTNDCGNCERCQYRLEQERIDGAVALAISALEKQIPKKPRHIDKNATFDGNWKRVCPACGRVLMERITTPEESYPKIYNHTPHCICGQAIDWEEEA